MKQRMIRFWLGLFQAIFPEHLRRDPAYWRRLALGIVVTFLVITQLFTFEKFADITSGWRVAGGGVVAALLAGLLPLLELGSLPFLLSMDTSRGSRCISQACLLVVSAVWFGMALWCFLAVPMSESGLFGATLPLLNGWWTVAFTGLLGVAVVLVVREANSSKSTCD